MSAEENPIVTEAFWLYDQGLNVFPIVIGQPSRKTYNFVRYTRILRERIPQLFYAPCHIGVALGGKFHPYPFVVSCSTDEAFFQQIDKLDEAEIPVWAVKNARGGHLWFRSRYGRVECVSPEILDDIKIACSGEHALYPMNEQAGPAPYWLRRDGMMIPKVHFEALPWLWLQREEPEKTWYEIMYEQSAEIARQRVPTDETPLKRRDAPTRLKKVFYVLAYIHHHCTWQSREGISEFAILLGILLRIMNNPHYSRKIRLSVREAAQWAHLEKDAAQKALVRLQHKRLLQRLPTWRHKAYVYRFEDRVINKGHRYFDESRGIIRTFNFFLYLPHIYRTFSELHTDHPDLFEKEALGIVNVWIYALVKVRDGVTRRELASFTGIGDDTMKRALRKLKQWGLVYSESNHYFAGEVSNHDLARMIQDSGAAGKSAERAERYRYEREVYASEMIDRYRLRREQPHQRNNPT